jgi:iron complex outermembrane recepter protein
MPRFLTLQTALLVALLVARAGVALAAPVRIGVPERENIQFLTLWVAYGAGYLQAEGLEVTLVTADAPNQSGPLLLGGQADIALLQPPVYLGLIAQQRPIVLFANLLANDPINLIVRSDVAARLKLDPHAPLVERVKALEGLRIGVANEPPRRLRVLLGLAGMDADRDIQMTIVPGEEQIAALTQGRIDALYTHTPYLEDALVNLGAVLLVNQSAGEVATLSKGQIHSLGTTRAYADAHPDVVLAVTRAIARAEELLHRDATAAGQALVKAGITPPTPKHLATIIDLYRVAVPATPQVSAAAVERDATLYPARPTMPDFTQVRAADFLAPAFAEQARSPEHDPSQPFYLGVVSVNVSAPASALSPVWDTLDRVEIQNHQALTVNQAIEYLPGVSVDHKAPRNQTGVSIGGFDSRQVPLYLDGIPAYVPYDGYVDLTRYLTSDVAAVQVAKGYSSALLGPNVLGGVVNVVSRQPERSVEGDAFIGTAPGNQLNAGLHAGSRWRTFFLQGSADRLQSDFYPISDAFALNAIQRDDRRVNSWQHDDRYRLRAAWTPRNQDQYVLSYSNQQGTTGVPPYSGTAPPCPAGAATLTTPCVTPKFWSWPSWDTDGVYFNSNTGVGPSSAVRIRAFYVRYVNALAMFDDATYSSMNLSANSGTLTNRDRSVGVSGEFETRGLARQVVSASFFVKDDTHAEQTTTVSRANLSTTTPAQEDRDRQSSFGIQDVITLTSNLKATLGFSADHLNGLQAQDLSSDRTRVVPFQVPGVCTTASATSFASCTDHLWTYNPVGALTYGSERSGTLFVTAAHKSRFPTIKDRYSYKAGRAVPNPSLDPERATTWTVGYSRTVAAKTVAQVDLFHSDVRDEIENIFFLSPLCGGGGGRGTAGSCQQAVNVGSELHSGVNLTLRTTSVPRLTLDANYSYLHRDISDVTGVFPTGTPIHKSVVTATMRLPKGIMTLASARYLSGIVAMSDNGLPLPTAGFTTVDIGAAAPVRNGLSLQGGIRNLFDGNYYYWEGFPEAGRNAYLTLRYTF